MHDLLFWLFPEFTHGLGVQSAFGDCLCHFVVWHHQVLCLFIGGPLVAELVELSVLALFLESDLDPFVLLAHRDACFPWVHFELTLGLYYFEGGLLRDFYSLAAWGHPIDGTHDHIVLIAVAVRVDGIDAYIGTVAAFLDFGVAQVGLRTPLAVDIAIAQDAPVLGTAVFVVHTLFYVTVIPDQTVWLHIRVDGRGPHSILGLELQGLRVELFLHLAATSIGGLIPWVAEVVAQIAAVTLDELGGGGCVIGVYVLLPISLMGLGVHVGTVFAVLAVFLFLQSQNRQDQQHQTQVLHDYLTIIISIGMIITLHPQPTDDLPNHVDMVRVLLRNTQSLLDEWGVTTFYGYLLVGEEQLLVKVVAVDGLASPYYLAHWQFIKQYQLVSHSLSQAYLAISPFHPSNPFNYLPLFSQATTIKITPVASPLSHLLSEALIRQTIQDGFVTWQGQHIQISLGQDSVDLSLQPYHLQSTLYSVLHDTPNQKRLAFQVVYVSDGSPHEHAYYNINLSECAITIEQPCHGKLYRRVEQHHLNTRQWLYTIDQLVDPLDRLNDLLLNQAYWGRVIYLRGEKGTYKIDMLTLIADLSDRPLTILDAETMTTLPDAQGLVVIKNAGEIDIKKIKAMKVGRAQVVLVDSYSIEDDKSSALQDLADYTIFYPRISQLQLQAILKRDDPAQALLKPKRLKQVREWLQQPPQEQTDQIGKTELSGVGGMDSVKEEIKKTMSLGRKYPEVFGKLVQPRCGLLLWGPPGCGKTLLAKCIAKDLGMALVSVKGPELLNMYIGESERNIREVFRRARAERPCVIFLDEFDALAPNRESSNDGGGVMDRVVSQFINELDSVNNGLGAHERVYVLAATNRPDMIDPSLLRSGRLATQVYLGVQTDPKDRRAMLRVQLQDLPLECQDREQLIDNIEKEVAKNFTGADWQALVQQAVISASQRHIDSIKDRPMAEQRDTSMAVTEEDLRRAARGVLGSG